MKILLTGGSGFIGSHFHNFIPHEKLINLDIIPPKFQHNTIFVKGDIRVKEDVRAALKDHDVKTIISLAAKHHDFGIGHEEYFDTNEEGTRIICSAATERGIKEFVFFSSVAVYGPCERPSSEDQTPKPDAAYGASKLAAERVLTEWAAEDPERKVLIIRPTVVFGPNNVANMFNLIRQIDSGLYFHIGKADNIKSIAYVENIVQATLFLMERMTPGISILNYADEPQLTSREIAETIADELNKKVRLTLPRWLALAVGLPFDFVIKLTGKNLPVSTARIKKLNTQTFHSPARVLATGFRPPFTTSEGLRKMVRWYQTFKAPPA